MTNEEAIEVINDIYNYKKWDTYTANEARTMAIKALEQTKWIPVSERLPGKTGKYLVTVKNGNVYAGVFDECSGKFQCAATAWMPLPEPFEEEGD